MNFPWASQSCRQVGRGPARLLLHPETVDKRRDSRAGLGMFDEMTGAEGGVRPPCARIAEWINRSGLDLLRQRSAEAEAIFRRIGITFAVYGEGGDPERLIPFDLIPRVFSAAE